jgi:hypothetical protein
MQSAELKGLGPRSLPDFSISGAEHSTFLWELKLFHLACILKNLHHPDITVTEINMFKK